MAGVEAGQGHDDASAEPDAAGLLEEDVAAISHDMKNPLSMIALDVLLLDRELGSATTTSARRALRRIAQNVAFVDRMVHDLLDLSSIDSDRFEVYREPTKLDELLVEIIERIVPAREAARVHVELRSHPRVLIDAARIERVIANLVQNALKYSTGQLSIVLDTHADKARISVTDEGPGLHPEQVNQLFAKHQRCGASPRHDGSGLGLYVSRKIVEAHAGRIGVDSCAGRGSTFYVELPLHAEP